MIVCRLDVRHVINKYKQTKFSVVVDILPKSCADCGRLTKAIIWKKKGSISLYSRIIAELNNI